MVPILLERGTSNLQKNQWFFCWRSLYFGYKKSWIIACLIYIYIWRGVFKISFSISYFKVIQRNVRCVGKDMKIGWASQEDRSFSQRFQLIGIKDPLKCFCEENCGFSTHNCDQKQYVFRWRLWWFFSVTYDSQRSSESCIWIFFF